MKKPVSIIIPAYRASGFIGYCIDSIEAQRYFIDNDNYEILIGVDGCTDTADMLWDVASERTNLRVLFMESNEGTYITLNTLIANAKYDNILRFDADDIMNSYFIERGMEALSRCDLVCFSHHNFFNKKVNIISTDTYFPHGAILFKKKIIKQLGGYKPWRSLGDRDFIERAKSVVKVEHIKEPLFYRRIHDKSISSDSKHGLNSKYSANIRRKVGASEDGSLYVSPVFNSYSNALDDIEVGIAPISIVVAAYKAQGFIEECLDSIENQMYFRDNDNFEVLVGVDGCQQTHDKIQEIKHKYRNLRVLVNDGNYGAYVTVNALMSAAKHDIILRFDADDVMKPNLVKRGVFHSMHHDIVMFGYEVFNESIEDAKLQNYRCADGAIFVKKELFERVGGFRPWSCAADSEFLFRVKRHADICKLKARLFYRRVHSNNLTRAKETSLKSEVRLNYRSMTRVYGIDEDIKIEMVKAKYKEL